MRDLSKLKTMLDLAREVESKDTDEKLAEGVKRTTKTLMKYKPEITYEEIISKLLLSAIDSYKHMINSEDIDPSVDLFMKMANMIVEEEGESFNENEEVMLRYILKGQIVTNMVYKSFNVSVKAVTELWNGTKGMES
jgi:lipopolysaccharide biosynthesis regulator YciM